MSKGGSTPSGSTTTTTSSAPWSGQQPYLTSGFQQAQNLFNQGGPQYYPGQTYAGPTDLQLQGIQNEANIGLSGTDAQNAANPALTNMLGSNWLGANPSNPLYSQASSGGLNVNTGGYFQPLASGQETNNMGLAPISAIASGQLTNTAGQDTLNQFANGSMLSANNPYFQQMAATTAANVMPQLQSQFDAGNRLDSGLATRAASEGLSDSIGGLAYNNYQQGLQQAQSAASNLGQLGAGNLGAQLQAGGLMSNIGQQNISNQLAGANALTNLGFSNIGTQLSGAQGLGQNFQSAAQNQLGALGLAPNIGNMDYQQAAALQDAGQTTQGLNQQAITDAMNRYNYGQQQPYQNLQTYMGNITGNYGSQGSSTQPYFENQLANLLGTGVGATSLLNGLFGSGSGGSSLLSNIGNFFSGGSNGLNQIAQDGGIYF